MTLHVARHEVADGEAAGGRHHVGRVVNHRWTGTVDSTHAGGAGQLETSPARVESARIQHSVLM